MGITNDVSNSLMQYFNTLMHTGYKSYNEVEKLVIYICIEEILTGPMSFFITEEDYKIINKALYCLYGTCLIPYPTYIKGINSIKKSQPNRYRYSEDNIIRYTENNNLRVES